MRQVSSFNFDLPVQRIVYLLEIVASSLDPLQGNEESKDIVGSLKNAEDSEIAENPLKGVI